MAQNIVTWVTRTEIDSLGYCQRPVEVAVCLCTAALRLNIRFCRVSCACSIRIGPCILLMSPQLDQDLEQRPVSLQPTGDGFKIGPGVMPVNSVMLSDGRGHTAGRTRAGPFRAGSGDSALARQGT